MKRILMLMLTLIFLLSVSTAQAAVSYTGTVTPDPATWTTGITGYVGINTGDGTLNIDGGSSVTLSSLGVAWNNGCNGTINISGTTATSSLTADTVVRLGFNSVGGTGTVNVDGNAVFNSTGANFIMGVYAGTNGVLNVKNGATANIAGNNLLGGQVGATATATVNLGVNTSTTGTTGGIFNSGSLQVGYKGIGYFNAYDGSDVNTMGSGKIGVMAGATGTMVVDNSTWDMTSYLRIGSSGVGHLTVQNGGVVNVPGDYVAIARNDGTEGSSLVVDGADSELNWTGTADAFYVGRNGNATMTVSDGGVVSAAGNAVLGYRGSYNGTTTTDNISATVTDSGSEWQIGGALAMGDVIDSRTFPLSELTTTLNIDSSGVVSVAKETFVGSGLAGVDATIDFDGGTLNTGCLGANLADLTGTGTVNTNGIITDGAMVLDETGDLVQTLTSGSVTINLDMDGTGTVGTGYDGTGSLAITDGVVLESVSGMIAHNLGSDGTVSVTGADTKWVMDEVLYVGQMGAGTLEIYGGAEVEAYTLCIDYDVAYEAAGGFASLEESFSATADSVVKIANLGQLTLAGDLTADILTFMSVVQGSSGAIQIYDHNHSWVGIEDAIIGTDISLSYDAGTHRTTLTALTVPEPSTLLLLLGLVFAGLILRKK